MKQRVPERLICILIAFCVQLPSSPKVGFSASSVEVADNPVFRELPNLQGGQVWYRWRGTIMYILNSLQGICRAVLFGGLVLTQQGAAADKHKCAEPQTLADSTYSPGQVWSYKARPGESASTVTILRIETLPKVGVIIHVRIDGVHFKNCTGGPAPTTVQHAPFTKAAIDLSVTTSSELLPRYQDLKRATKTGLNTAEASTPSLSLKWLTWMTKRSTLAWVARCNSGLSKQFL